MPFTALTRTTLASLWLIAVGWGIAVLLNYQTQKGTMGDTPEFWPSDTPLPLAVDRPTMLLFAHPRCPCTRASIHELNRLLARSKDQAASWVLLYQPGDRSESFTHTDLRRSASGIPEVNVKIDRDGALARRFGAETSGFVVLYDAHGQLLFKGGITLGRGHEGDNPGANAIVGLLDRQYNEFSRTPVYGCALLDACGTSIEKGAL